MEKVIGENVFEIQDEVYMRQMVEIGKLNKKLNNGEITNDELIIEMMIVMVKRINENTNKESFSDFILDNLTPDDFTKLSDQVMGVVDKFIKKNENMNTNIQSFGVNEVENSVMNGEKS